MIKFNIGDLVVLKNTYRDYGKTAVIVNIDQSEMPGEGGWTSFAYQIMTETGKLVHITESCIDSLVKE